MTVCAVNRLINSHCYELAVLYLSFKTSELSVATCLQIWRGAIAGNGLLKRQLEQSKTEERLGSWTRVKKKKRLVLNIST